MGAEVAFCSCSGCWCWLHYSTALASSPLPRTQRRRRPTLEVQSPENLRGGLIFQARFTITARERLAQAHADPSAWLVRVDVGQLDRPRRGAGKTRATAVVRLTYPPLAAGSSRVVWIYFQVNPTNLGQRSQDVVLSDGSRQLAAVHRSVRVWP